MLQNRNAPALGSSAGLWIKSTNWTVAQVFNLLCRRFSIGKALPAPGAPEDSRRPQAGSAALRPCP